MKEKQQYFFVLHFHMFYFFKLSSLDRQDLSSQDRMSGVAQKTFT